MFYDKKKKNLLFVEPCPFSQLYLEKAKTKGYKTLVISSNDEYLTFAQENLLGPSVFFQVDTQREEVVLNLVKQINEKFQIDGVIPGYGKHTSLTAQIAAILNHPGLMPQSAYKLQQKGYLQDIPKKRRIDEPIQNQEYSIEGLIKNKVVYIFNFIEDIVNDESEFFKLGYILRTNIDPHLVKHVADFLQDIAFALQLDYGFFNAKIKIMKKYLVLLKFEMRLAKDIIPLLINYSSGLDYYETVFELFSSQPLSFRRETNLNVGVIFFYEKVMNQKLLNEYAKKLAENSLMIETKEYSTEESHIQNNEAKTKILGHAILVHLDYETLKQYIKSIFT